MPLEDVHLGPPIWEDAVLPIEICEHIIDDLALDVKSLSACLLTCRSFFHRCQYLLEELSGGMQALYSSADVSRLATVLRSTNKQVYHITDLEICQPLDNLDISSFWVHSVPLKLAFLLPGVEQLHLKHIHFPLHPNFHFHLSAFKGIICLTLMKCRFSSFRELVQLILAFPRLKKLIMYNLIWETPGAGHGILPWGHLQNLKIQKIEFYSDQSDKEYFSDLAEWLRICPFIGCLQKLKVGPSSKLADWDALGRLLDMAFSLDKLYIYCNYLPLSNKLNSGFLHLKKASACTEITICEFPFSYFSSLTDELSYHISPHWTSLQDFRVEFTTEKNQLYAQSNSWELLDELLTGVNFPKLRYVIVNLEYTHFMDQFEKDAKRKQVQELLPLLHARDILQIDIFDNLIEASL